jgi:hypothetical protein
MNCSVALKVDAFHMHPPIYVTDKRMFLDFLNDCLAECGCTCRQSNEALWIMNSLGLELRALQDSFEHPIRVDKANSVQRQWTTKVTILQPQSNFAASVHMFETTYTEGIRSLK